MKFQELDPSIKRAYEIALAGGYSICLMGNISLREYIQEIKKILPDVQYKNPTEADLVIEVTNVDADYKRRAKASEGMEDILARIKAKTTIAEYVPDSVHETLMKTAMRRLDFTPPDVDKVNKIALTIAEISKADNVQLEHLAEAIHYRACHTKICPNTTLWMEIQENELAGYPAQNTAQTTNGIILVSVFADTLYTT